MNDTDTPAIRELTSAEMTQAAGGLLLPAVQAAREAARRAQCSFTIPAVANTQAAAARVSGRDYDGDGRAD